MSSIILIEIRNEIKKKLCLEVWFVQQDMK